MNIRITIYDFDRIRDYLKNFTEINNLEDEFISEYYNLRINFIQKTFSLNATKSKPEFEDRIFLEMLMQ